MAERRDKPDSTAAGPRKRALVSCDRCKLRRARCIREHPEDGCADCKLSGVACESKLPRKQRVYGSVETLSLRYRALESLVKGLFPQENTQDVNTLFRLAADRNIPMPATDDFTPADIFNNSNQRPSSLLQHQPLQQPTRQIQPLTTTLPYAISHHATDTAHSLDTASVASTSKSSQTNPFSEVHQSTRYTEELIPTKHGVPHYFGPSSSFRLATTIRTLVARYKISSGANFASLRASISTASESASASGRSLHRGSTNPSDEEYTVPNAREPSGHDRLGRKRSRAQMEETGDQWEHRNGSPNPDTIGNLLPSRSLADALVAAYFDHIHIYLPLFHRSMFQFRLEATYSRKSEQLKDCADIGWLVALALVFSFGCQQLQEHDPEQAHKLRLKYLSFAKTYFRQLLMTTCLVNVQALVLLNVHHHTMGQKSSSWLLIGLAARMAITMGMHRDGPNLEFDPIERNTRRQVFWSIYTFEKILCSILGRPTVIDDREMSMQIPDAPMLEQKMMSAEFMAITFELARMSYSMRQRAYFDNVSAEERSPTLTVAESLLHECSNFFTTIPSHMSLDHSPELPDQRSRILLLHVYYFYTRCIITRDFLIQKVERNICYSENKLPLPTEDWERTQSLSENCVESAHQSLSCIMAGAHLGMIGYSWLDLFFVFHSILIVCADFLARPRHQPDSSRDVERKEMVRAMLTHIRGLKKLAPTYKTLSEIAIQFANITGVADDSNMAHRLSTSHHLESQSASGCERATDQLDEISDVQEDWFANATMSLGLDFFDLNQATHTTLLPGNPNAAAYPGYFIESTASDVEDWTSRTLRGLHTM